MNRLSSIFTCIDLTTLLRRTAHLIAFCLKYTFHTNSTFLSFQFKGFPGVKRPGREADHLVRPVPGIRMSGAVPLFLLYAFGLWTEKTLLLLYL